MTADEWKPFEIRRAMICHEDGQVNQRIGFQLTTQSFLLAASAILLGIDTLPGPARGFLLFLVSSVAVILGFFFHNAVRAARKEQARLRGDEECERGRPSYDDVFKLHDDPAKEARLKACLQAHGVTFGGGFSYVPWVQGLMTLLWIPFWFLGLLEVFGVAVLARKTIVPQPSLPPEMTNDPTWRSYAMLAAALVASVAAIICAYYVAARPSQRAAMTPPPPRTGGA